MKNLAPRSQAWRRVGPIVLVILCGVVFSNALPDEFVMDAQGLVRDNPRLRSDAPWRDIFLSNYWGDYRYFGGSYRPLTIAVLRLEYSMLGFSDDPKGYVVFNLLLHMTAVLLLWQLCRRWLRSEPGALCAAAFFAVHPIASEIVPNIVGMGDILATIFVITALLMWERYVETGQRRWIWITAGVWLLGLLSKESAVVLPGLVFIRDLARESKFKRSIQHFLQIRHLKPYGILLLTGGVWYILREAILADHRPRFVEALVNPMVLESTATRLMTAMRLVASYLIQTLVPVTLSADYSFNQIPMTRSPFDIDFLIAMLLLTGCGVGIVMLWRRKHLRFMAVGLSCFFITLSPVTNIVLVIATIRADRLLYLPLLGICLIMGVLSDRLLRWAGTSVKPFYQQTSVLIIVALGIGFYARTAYIHNPHWRHNLALWEHTATVSPNSMTAHYNLAWFLNRDRPDELDRMIRHLETAVRINRDLPGDEAYDAFINLGKMYINKAERQMTGGKLSRESIAWLNKAVDIFKEGEQRESYRGRRRAWWEQTVGRRQAAKGIPVEFGDPLLHVNLGTVLDNLQRPQEAIEQFKKAVAIDPTRAENHYHLAVLYTREGRPDLAEAHLSQVTRLDPAYEKAWMLTTEVHMRLGQYAQAVEAMATGRRHNPQSSVLRDGLQRAYRVAVEELRRVDRNTEAMALIEQAVERDRIDAGIFE